MQKIIFFQIKYFINDNLFKFFKNNSLERENKSLEMIGLTYSVL